MKSKVVKERSVRGYVLRGSGRGYLTRSQAAWDELNDKIQEKKPNPKVKAPMNGDDDWEDEDLAQENTTEIFPRSTAEQPFTVDHQVDAATFPEKEDEIL